MLAIKRIVKYLISKLLSLNFLERLSQNKIWREIIEQKKPEIVSSVNGKLSHDEWNKILRYKVWDRVHEYINIDEDILYLEFGVWQGLSIKYFAKIFNSKNSEFYGFDTFQGMPKEWRFLKKGHYSTSGEIPKTEDKRIKFFKGLFQETLPKFLNNLNEESKNKKVLIHFDCVLHSSTLYTLFALNEFKNNYYFLFDELGTDECRAFRNFNMAKMKDYDLYLASKYNGAPEVVFGKFKG